MHFQIVQAAPEVFLTYKGWDNTLKQAKENDKQILFYFGAEWCIPCKQLLTGAFIDSGAVGFLKQQFISFHFDADAPQSLPLLEKYRIASYPKILILDQSGFLKGALDNINQAPQGFIEQLNQIARSIIVIKGVSNSLTLGYPEFYTEYFKTHLAKKPDSLTVTKYLNGQGNLFSEVNWNVMSLFSYDSKYLNYIIQHRKKYEDLYGSSVPFRIYEITTQLRRVYMGERDSVKYNRLLQEFLPDPSDAGYKRSVESYLMKEIFFLAKTGMDWPKFIARSKSYINSYGAMSNQFICNYIYYSDCQDVEVYKFMLTQSAFLLEKDPNNRKYLMYHGCFLYKSGDQANAASFFQKAIGLSKSAEQREKTLNEISKIKEGQGLGH